MKQVIVYKAGEIDPNTREATREISFTGVFHCFSHRPEPTEKGPVQVPCAIIQKPDGSVVTVALHNIVFDE